MNLKQLNDFSYKLDFFEYASHSLSLLHYIRHLIGWHFQTMYVMRGYFTVVLASFHWSSCPITSELTILWITSSLILHAHISVTLHWVEYEHSLLYPCIQQVPIWWESHWMNSLILHQSVIIGLYFLVSRISRYIVQGIISHCPHSFIQSA